MIAAEIIIPSLLLLAILYLTIEYSLFIPGKKGLPVLMYHNITEGFCDGLNIPADKLELQLMYMKEKGYQTITLKQLSEICRNDGRLPAKAVLLTFDDAFTSSEKPLLKLLERYGFQAVIFLPVAFIGKSNMWDDGKLEILPAESLQRLSRDSRFEIGLHSFLHRSYSDLGPEDIQEDLKNCQETLDYYKISFVRAIAYPYGGYPRKDNKLKQEMFEVFRNSGIEFAFRIGNRINSYPFKERYELTRIDIKGTDSFFIFKTKLKKGRAKVFA